MTRYIWALLITFFGFILTVEAQDVIFKVEFNSDTLLVGNILEIKYTVENGQGDFEAPDFKGLRIVSGPNVSSQFSMVNGNISQKATYTYYLEAAETGLAHIGEASFNNESGILLLDPIAIIVKPNPDGETLRRRKYGFSQIITFKDSSDTKLDSLKQKLKRVKTIKI